MNDIEKDTYHSIHQMRLEITQEAIQNLLLQYIKENRDEVKLNEFCQELLKAQKSRKVNPKSDKMKLAGFNRTRRLSLLMTATSPTAGEAPQAINIFERKGTMHAKNVDIQGKTPKIKNPTNRGSISISKMPSIRGQLQDLESAMPVSPRSKRNNLRVDTSALNLS